MSRAQKTLMYTLSMSRLVWNMFCLVRGCARPKARGARVGRVRCLCLPPALYKRFFFIIILWFSVCAWFCVLSIASIGGGELLEGCLVQPRNVPCVFLLGHFQALCLKALVCAGRQQWCCWRLGSKRDRGGGRGKIVTKRCLVSVGCRWRCAPHARELGAIVPDAVRSQNRVSVPTPDGKKRWRRECRGVDRRKLHPPLCPFAWLTLWEQTVRLALGATFRIPRAATTACRSVYIPWQRLPLHVSTLARLRQGHRKNVCRLLSVYIYSRGRATSNIQSWPLFF